MFRNILIIAALLCITLAIKPSTNNHALRVQTHQINVEEIMSEHIANKVDYERKNDTETQKSWEARVDAQYEQLVEDKLDDLKVSGSTRTTLEADLDEDWVRIKAQAWEKNFEVTLKQMGVCMIVLISLVMLH